MLFFLIDKMGPLNERISKFCLSSPVFVGLGLGLGRWRWNPYSQDQGHVFDMILADGNQLGGKWKD